MLGQKRFHRIPAVEFGILPAMHNRQPGFQEWVMKEWWWLSYLSIFSFAFLLLLGLQASPVFADPDSFYHAKMAVLMRDQGLITQFPWLDLTVLGQTYTNQHLLYHVALIPFVTLLPPLMGVKLATVFFGAILATVVYWLLRSFNVRWAFLFVVILLLIRPFVFRISLAKAPSTSLIFLIVGLGWIFHYHLKRLGVLAFTYVWYYGGFALLGVSAVVYALTSTAMNRLTRLNVHQRVNKIFSLIGRHARRERQRRMDLWVVATVLIGTVAGLIINPYFPTNLAFYSHQLINIGVINFRNVIGVGGEWYPYAFADLVSASAFASLLILLALAASIIRWRRPSKQTITLAILTVFFFLLTIKSRRYVEYYVPIAVLFAAFSLNDTLGGAGGKAWTQELKRLFLQTRWSRWLAGALVAVVLFGAGYLAARDYVGNWQDLRRGFPATRLQAVSEWLQANTPPGSRIVHSDWDEFPVLFYHNSHNTYIVGLDPTFLYKADQERYWTWVDITLGKYTEDVYQAVTTTLDSRYVLIADNHDAMERLIERDGRFMVRYRDAEAVVYEAQNQQP